MQTAWPLVKRWIDQAANAVTTLPADAKGGERALAALDVTERSVLGALAVHTGGLSIDHGWLRVLGGAAGSRHRVQGPPPAVHARGARDRGCHAHAGADDRAVGHPAGVRPPVRRRLMRRRLPLALFFLGAGIMHFVKPRAYEATVPDALPLHTEIVYVSGVAEIAGALALLDRRSAPWGG